MTDSALHNRSMVSLLEKLGLSRNEVKCYLASLALGRAAVSEIAKAADINRANAYGAIKALSGRGLLEQEVTPRGRRIRAAPLEALKGFALDYQKRATKLRWRVEDLIPALTALVSRGGEQAKLLMFEGTETIFTMLERTLRVPAGSELLEMCLFVNEDVVARIDYSKNVYIPQRIQNKCFKKLLCLKNDRHLGLVRHDKDELRETRFIPQAYEKGVDMCNVNIYGDEVSLYWHAKEPTGVIVQSKRIADVMRSLFKMAWEVAERPKKG